MSLEAGACANVNFDLSMRSLSMVDKHGTRHTLAGEHELVFSRGHGSVLRQKAMVLFEAGEPRAVISNPFV